MALYTRADADREMQEIAGLRARVARSFTTCTCGRTCELPSPEAITQYKRSGYLAQKMCAGHPFVGQCTANELISAYSLCDNSERMVQNKLLRTRMILQEKDLKARSGRYILVIPRWGRISQAVREGMSLADCLKAGLDKGSTKLPLALRAGKWVPVQWGWLLGQHYAGFVLEMLRKSFDPDGKRADKPPQQDVEENVRVVDYVPEVEAPALIEAGEQIIWRPDGVWREDNKVIGVVRWMSKEQHEAAYGPGVQ